MSCQTPTILIVRGTTLVPGGSSIKRLGGITTLLLVLAVPNFAVGHTSPADPTGQKTLAATTNACVFPNTGHKPEQQSQQQAARQMDDVKKAFSVCPEAKSCSEGRK